MDLNYLKRLVYVVARGGCLDLPKIKTAVGLLQDMFGSVFCNEIKCNDMVYYYLFIHFNHYHSLIFRNNIYAIVKHYTIAKSFRQSLDSFFIYETKQRGANVVYTNKGLICIPQ